MYNILGIIVFVWVMGFIVLAMIDAGFEAGVLVWWPVYFVKWLFKEFLKALKS